MLLGYPIIHMWPSSFDAFDPKFCWWTQWTMNLCDSCGSSPYIPSFTNYFGTAYRTRSPPYSVRWEKPAFFYPPWAEQPA
jgi:hypothetical protein